MFEGGRLKRRLYLDNYDKKKLNALEKRFSRKRFILITRFEPAFNTQCFIYL